MKILCALITLCFLPVHSLVGQTTGSRLLGTWELSLWVTDSPAKSAGPRTASGVLELRRLEMEQAESDFSEIYSVTYDTTLHLMLGVPRAGPAQAVLKGRGTVELIFNPFVDHGAFRLAGVLRADSITGEWYRTNFADDRYRGSFRMVRAPESPRER